MTGRRLYLLLELLLLWVAAPVGLTIYYYLGNPVIMPFFILWPLSLVCLIALLADKRFPNRMLWNASAIREHLPKVLLRFAVMTPVLAVLVWISLDLWLHQPERYLGFPRHRPDIWALVLVLYPILSVYPQSIVYRSFIMHRYRDLLPGNWPMAIISGLLFGLMHVIFLNFVGPIITTLGGIFFARTYQRSQSLLITSIEHALYGCLIFTLGWGKFFYHAAT